MECTFRESSPGNELSRKLAKKWQIFMEMHYQSLSLLDKTDRKEVRLRDLFETKENEEMSSQRMPRASKTKLLSSQSHFTCLFSKTVSNWGFVDSVLS